MLTGCPGEPRDAIPKPTLNLKKKKIKKKLPSHSQHGPARLRAGRGKEEGTWRRRADKIQASAMADPGSEQRQQTTAK
ncbi:uncharacterized protein ACO6RY_05908 [Pungitius sinensis]